MSARKLCLLGGAEWQHVRFVLAAPRFELACQLRHDVEASRCGGGIECACEGSVHGVRITG
jgi:hypothetical protein